MKIINIFKTYKYYNQWKKIIKFNKNELLAKGFLLNWIYQLGLVVTLSKEDMDDLKNIYDPFQFEIAKNQFMNNNLKNTLKKHNEFFLEQGLLEIIDDNYEIEESEIQNFTYYITLSFKIFYFKFWQILLFVLSILTGLYFILYY